MSTNDDPRARTPILDGAHATAPLPEQQPRMTGGLASALEALRKRSDKYEHWKSEYYGHAMPDPIWADVRAVLAAYDAAKETT